MSKATTIRRMISVALAAVLTVSVCVLSGCGGAGETAIIMSRQSYDEDGSIVEVPKFVSEGKSSSIDKLNVSVSNSLANYVRGYGGVTDDTYEWYEIKSYPVSSEDYLQVVVTAVAYPNYATQGEAFSFNYDKKNDSILTLADALASFGSDTNDELDNIGALFEPYAYEGDIYSHAVPCGFIIQNSGVIMIVRVFCRNELASDYDALFVYRTDSGTLSPYDGNILFDAGICDSFEPPLFYEQNTVAGGSDGLEDVGEMNVDAAMNAAADAAAGLFPGFTSIGLVSISVIDGKECCVFDIAGETELVGSIAVSGDLSAYYVDAEYDGCYYRTDGSTVDTSMEYFAE